MIIYSATPRTTPLIHFAENKLSDEETPSCTKEQLIGLEEEWYRSCEEERSVVNRDWDGAASLRNKTDELRKQIRSYRELYPEIAKEVDLELVSKKNERRLRRKLSYSTLPRGTFAIDSPDMPISRINIDAHEGIPLALLTAIFIACEKSINLKAHKQGLSLTYLSKSDRGSAGSYNPENRRINIYGNLDNIWNFPSFDNIWNLPSDELKKLCWDGDKGVLKMDQVIQVLIHEFGHDLESAINDLLPPNVKNELVENWRASVKEYYQSLTEQDKQKSEPSDELQLLINNPDVIMIFVNESEDEEFKTLTSTCEPEDSSIGKVMYVPLRVYKCSYKEIMAELYRLHCFENYCKKHEHKNLSYQELIERGGRGEKEMLKHFESLYYMLRSLVFENGELIEKVRRLQKTKTETVI